MATWGEFLQEFVIYRPKASEMYVKVDDVLGVWEERNQLRNEVAELKAAIERERDLCAREVEEFAEACAVETEPSELVVTVLRAAAQLIRERGLPQADEPAIDADPIGGEAEPDSP
jgi:hypothetical protein